MKGFFLLSSRQISCQCNLHQTVQAARSAIAKEIGCRASDLLLFGDGHALRDNEQLQSVTSQIIVFSKTPLPRGQTKSFRPSPEPFDREIPRSFGDCQPAGAAPTPPKLQPSKRALPVVEIIPQNPIGQVPGVGRVGPNDAAHRGVQPPPPPAAPVPSHRAPAAGQMNPGKYDAAPAYGQPQPPPATDHPRERGPVIVPGYRAPPL
jgi:hypothetical protein